MSIIIVRAVILVIPLDREPKYTVYLSASHLNILSDITVGDIAGVRPTKTISPLEHGPAVLFSWSNQRDHVGCVSVFQQGLHRSGRWEHVLDEVLNRNLPHPRKFLRIDRNVTLHLAENIINRLNTLCSITVSEKNIVHCNVVQSSKPSTQGRQISKVGNRLLRILQHFLRVNRLRPLVVCRGYDCLILANRLVQIHPLANVHQEGAHAVIADAANGHTCLCRLFPNKVVPELVRSGSIHCLILLELFQSTLPFLTFIEGLLTYQLQHGVDGIVRNLFQRPHEHILSVTK